MLICAYKCLRFVVFFNRSWKFVLWKCFALADFCFRKSAQAIIRSKGNWFPMSNTTRNIVFEIFMLKYYFQIKWFFSKENSRVILMTKWMANIHPFICTRLSDEIALLVWTIVPNFMYSAREARVKRWKLRIMHCSC